MSSGPPPVARAFLASRHGRAAARIARSFHAWLERKDVGLALADTMPDSVWRFVSVAGSSSRARYRSQAEAGRRWHQLFPYLVWLSGQGQLAFDPEVLCSAPPPPPPDVDPYSGSPTDPHFLWCHQTWKRVRRRRYRHRRQLPDAAERFLGVLGATRKASTIGGYSSSLGRLYAFLAGRRTALLQLTRHHLEDWFQSLHTEGLHAATRLQLITHARTHLRWAYDEGLVIADPDELIRRSDLPKLPTYLPRPLPPEVDQVLQARLTAGGRYQRALLVMRRTGLRIGELIQLEHQCVRTDPNGRQYLKVSLGKLDTERLVPLDEQTLALVRDLQEGGPTTRASLIGDVPRTTLYQVLRRELAHASGGLKVTEPLTSHRLRHTFATTLLAGGMTLPALMRILGHRDHRMTLRYAAITDDVMVKEYHAALAKLGARYQESRRSQLTPVAETEPAPEASLTDLMRWVKSRSIGRQAKNALLARISRLIESLHELE
jgi:site-specific recombinase XerD